LRISILFIFSFFLSISAQAKILVYEYGLLGDGDNHGVYVTQIACRNLVYTCETFYSEVVSEADLLSAEDDLESGDVVNMSFTFQKPSQPRSGPGLGVSDDGVSEVQMWERYYQNLVIFENEKKTFEKVMLDNKEVLFVLASGNGFSYKGWPTLGVPLGEDYKIYPALIEENNTIRVAAVDASEVSIADRKKYRIEDYSNYSVDNVEIAAPVETNSQGEELTGTSFAAPYVTRLSKRLIEEKSISAEDVKKILLRSAYIENLDKTLEVTREYIEDRKSSILYKIHTSTVRREREELRARISDVMLVKSGGVLVSEIAFACATNYISSQDGKSIDDSCLEAHKSVLSANKERLEKLKGFWRLREL